MPAQLCLTAVNIAGSEKPLLIGSLQQALPTSFCQKE
uniref:Uncharacterized protein n=1 Tax=Anguilla anguilla TaxID=7936 RepID=A0A0E9TU51_ANGAN